MPASAHRLAHRQASQSRRPRWTESRPAGRRTVASALLPGLWREPPTHSAAVATLSHAPDYGWLDELPTSRGPPDLKMGVQKLLPDAWLPPDSLTAVERDIKAHLLADGDGMVLWEPGCEAACDELLAAVARFRAVTDAELGEVQRRSAHAIDATARLVAEDLMVMQRDAHDWRLVAGSLVFNNQWQLRDKLGGTLSEIHTPTEGYEELLADKVHRFFDRLPTGQLFWRRNWFFHDFDTYRQPDRAEFRTIASASDVEPLWVRSERETMCRLPESDAIIFTIKTQMAPIGELRRRREKAQEVAEHLGAASPRGLRGKDAVGRDAALIAYLHSEL